MKRLLLLLVLIFPLSCYSGLSDMLDNVGAKIPICVNSTTADDSRDGRGWANAKKTLQAAVNAAESGDEIWITGDVIDSGFITINKPLELYGGFTGSETARSSSSAKSKITTRVQVSPSVSGAVFEGLNFNTSIQRGLFIGIGSMVTIRKCEFKNNYVPSNGAAISLESSSLIIYDSVFQNNNSGGSGSSGGAVYALNSDLTVENSHFGGSTSLRNQADFGAAIAFNGPDKILIIRNSHFNDNEATSNGGAIYITGNNNRFKIENSHFGDEAPNSADTGGAIYVQNGSGEITGGTVIKNNTATVNGGGIYARDCPNITISDNTQFYRNSSASSGGAVYLYNSTLYVSNSIFGGDSLASGNKATGLSANGGAIYGESNSNLTLSGTRIRYNQAAGSGGGVFHWGGILDIKNDSYVQNNQSEQQGGGIIAEIATVNISDSYILNNNSKNVGAGFRFFSCSVIITDSEISGNIINNATYPGGGVNFFSINTDKFLHIINCRINNNTTGSSGGGGIYFNSNHSGVDLIIEKTEFDSNSSGGSGGAIYFNSPNGKFSMESCIVKNHNTNFGSAVHVTGGIGNKFVNSFFYNNNYTTSSTANGGALWLGTPSFLANLTFYKNSSASGGAITLGAAGTYYLYNSVFFGNTDAIIGTGSDNIKTPLNVILYTNNCFYNNGIDAYTHHDSLTDIKDDSTLPFLSIIETNVNFLYPADNIQNKGGDTYIDTLIYPTDLAGKPRKVGTVDIGAYERQ